MSIRSNNPQYILNTPTGQRILAEVRNHPEFFDPLRNELDFVASDRISKQLGVPEDEVRTVVRFAQRDGDLPPTWWITSDVSIAAFALLNGKRLKGTIIHGKRRSVIFQFEGTRDDGDRLRMCFENGMKMNVAEFYKMEKLVRTIINETLDGRKDTLNKVGVR